MRRCVIVMLLVSSTLFAQSGGRRRAAHHPSNSVAAPIAIADSYSVDAGGTLTVAAPGVFANDTLHGALLASFGAATGAEETTAGRSIQTSLGGSLSLAADGGFTYTPSASLGTDTFRYVVRNAGGSSTATVTINVAAVRLAAADDFYSTRPEAGMSIPAPGILTNDALAGGRITSFGPRTGQEQESSSGASSATLRGGRINLAPDGGFSYLPPPTTDDGYGYMQVFTGQDAFRYTIQSGSETATATVTVTVDTPSAGEDYVVTTPGHYYAISGLTGENPILTLKRGKTYRFRINAPGHPFAILDAPAGAVIDNNIIQGTVTFVVPEAAQSYRYRCTTHGFGNVIQTEP